MDTSNGSHVTVPAALKAIASSRGADEYVVSTDARLTYTDAEQRSAVLARRFLAHGVGKGTRIGLLLPNGIDWVICWLAASRIGAVVMPFSTMYTAHELNTALRLGDVHLLIAAPRVLAIDVAARLEEALPELASSGPTIRTEAAPYLRAIWTTSPLDRSWCTRVDLDDKTPPDVSPRLLTAVEAEVTPADSAVVIFTSGSSGTPKGVVLSHGTVMRQSAAVVPALRSMADSDMPRYLCAMAFFWIAGILNLSGALHESATLMVMERVDPGPALEFVERERANLVIGWPTVVQRMRAHPDFATRDLSSAPSLQAGPADTSLIGRDDHVPRHRAMTETSGTFLTTETRVADVDGRPVDDGNEGELLVRGPGIMDGYVKRERSDVFDADGWYHTGDRVVRSQGELLFVGRSTELIKSAGANVSPREVEGVIEELPGVMHSFVVGAPNAERGEEVVAVVVPRAGGLIDPVDLADQVRHLLSPYKVPTRWIITTSDRVPTLANGKPNKRAIAALVVAGELR